VIRHAQDSDYGSLSSYQALCQQIKIGDVLTFSGQDIPSSVVKLATRSHYVHVAIVLSVESNSQQQLDILIAESHIDISLPSVGTGKRVLGVQFQWLSDRLTEHDGQVWWVPLKQPLTPEGLCQMQAWLREIEAERIPYDFLQAIEVGIEPLVKPKAETRLDLSALFCSELVTRALQLANVVDATLNPSEQTPSDVMQFPCFEKPVLIHNLVDDH
jgi:hypothetical protein